MWSWLRCKLGLVRPPREVYVRTSRPAERTEWSVEPGVEFRPADNFNEMTQRLYDVCYQADRRHPLPMPEHAEEVARLIQLAWPDRAYFVEVHGDAGWIQIFQPFGIPRNP